MAFECGYLSWSRSHRDDVLRAITRQNAYLSQQPLNGYPSVAAANKRMQSDAAARRQDRGDFERYIRLDRFPDLLAAARLMRERWAVLYL